MYAVIKTGGKQYKVAANDEIVVEKIDGKDAGDEFAFEDVLMIGDGDKVTVGAPSVKGAAVVGEVVEHGKGDKVIIFKKRQRSTYKRKRGHRQLQTIVKITEIMADGFDASKLKKASKKPAAKADDTPEAKKAAPKKAAAKAEVKEEAPKAKTAAAPKEDAPKAKAEAPKKTGATKKETAASDDLTQLKGVGPAYAKKLNEAGITSFAQLASLTPEGVTELEEKLNASGRVERDGWIEQAKELAK